MDKKCEKAEALYRFNLKQAHRRIKELKHRKFTNSSGIIKDKDGTILFEENDIKRYWLEYVKELYDEPNRCAPPLYFKEPLIGSTILKSEIPNALSSIRNGKALGSDKISAETLKALNHFGVELLQLLAGAVDCENFRTISIMSHMAKAILRVIMLRIRNKIHPEISTEQYGFMKDKGTKNAIFVLRMLSERAIQMQQTMYLYFIDWKKAFDRVNHEKLLQLLNKIGIDSKDLRLIQALYYEQTANVKIDNDISGDTLIKKGVRQDCVLSPDLFNLYSEIILRDINDFEGIKVNGVNINNIPYADDTVFISTSPRELQKMLNELQKMVNNMECQSMSTKQNVS